MTWLPYRGLQPKALHTDGRIHPGQLSSTTLPKVPSPWFYRVLMQCWWTELWASPLRKESRARLRELQRAGSVVVLSRPGLSEDLGLVPW